MALQGPASLLAQRYVKLIALHASVLALVAGVMMILNVSLCHADSERLKKSLLTKRKVGAASGYGIRIDPINKRKDFHKGIDISRPTGTDVFSWADGTVVKAGWMGDYGYAVDIAHWNGVKTRYAHLKAVHVRTGQHVRIGQTLGQVGRTGRTTGANLHFEVMENGRLVDPRKHLSEAAQIVSRRNNQGG